MRESYQVGIPREEEIRTAQGLLKNRVRSRAFQVPREVEAIPALGVSRQ